MQSFHVLTMGRMSLGALAPGQALRVLAVFRRTFYCQSDDGALVCIGPPGMGAGPLNAIVPLPAGLDWPACGLRPGLRAGTDERTFRVGDLRFDLRGALRWRPPPIPGPASPSRLTEGLANLRAVWAMRLRSDGLGPMILPLATGSAELPPDLADAGPLVRAAWRSVRPLTGWLGCSFGERSEPDPPPAETENLIGLGPGLTPSGDDCLAGMLIALHALGAQLLASSLGRWVLSRAVDRTHRISLGHLACAAGGEGAEALHETLASLCSPGAPGLGRCLDTLGRIGHSSGWDALTGAVAGMRAVVAGAKTPASLPDSHVRLAESAPSAAGHNYGDVSRPPDRPSDAWRPVDSGSPLPRVGRHRTATSVPGTGSPAGTASRVGPGGGTDAAIGYVTELASPSPESRRGVTAGHVAGTRHHDGVTACPSAHRSSNPPIRTPSS
jgi:hypothetical protein